MIIDQLRRDIDLIVMICKDARSITLLVGNTNQDGEEDSCSMFYRRLRESLSVPSIDETFAFQYHKFAKYPDSGWHIYNAEKYFTTLLEESNSLDSWYITHVNHDYSFSSTYPSVLVVPKSANDPDLLRQVVQYRSRGRLPVLCWKHRILPMSICRCSQPGVGITLAKSNSDKQLIEAIRQTNPLSPILYLVDARPKVSAIGNVIGPSQGGYEYDYKNCQMTFMNIENIHAMRDAWSALCNLITRSMQPNWDDEKWFSELENTGWLKYIKSVLAGSVDIVSKIDKNRSSVVMHCSDGWDRTSQLSAISQLLLDPEFRTMEGFEILIEKEWCSFGHRFAARTGLVSSSSAKDRNDRAPIFIQFLECVWQISTQFPSAFEFNEEFLICIADAVYDCRFGTFLENTEKERKLIRNKTSSLWSWTNLMENREKFTNPFFLPDDVVLYPCVSSKFIKFWDNYWLRWDPSHRQIFPSQMYRHKFTNNNTDTKHGEIEEIEEIEEV
eukprot:TRINITY_DN4578_c0_g1_i5.p1 TRINITY_DN4578_c0_g1~~TRINITY_DN4578_c0_g1_i5.p1  ORF type:complete len:499 (-),score=53.95 TRINITY_DN4578_c0_g1_i5:120-1616(-)